MSQSAFKQLADNAISTTTTDLSTTGKTTLTAAANVFPVVTTSFILTLWNGNDSTLDANMEKVVVSANASGVLTHSATTKTHTSPCNIAILPTAVHFSDLGAAINALESGSNYFAATTGAPGSVQLAGDLAGTATAPVVAKINGVAVTGTPTSGQIPIASSGTAAVWGTAPGASGSFTSALTVTVSSATALAVGANGATNPALMVKTDVASAATGILVTSNAAAAGVTLQVISSGTNEKMLIRGKGTSGLDFLAPSTTGTANNGGIQVNTQNSAAFCVGQQGTSGTAFNVSTAGGNGSGVGVYGFGAGAGATLQASSTSSNETLNVDGLGTGSVVIQHSNAPAVGGALNTGVRITSASSLGFFAGTGAPTLSARNGSLYVNVDGITSTTRLYINSSGASTVGTTWSPVTV